VNRYITGIDKHLRFVARHSGSSPHLINPGGSRGIISHFKIRFCSYKIGFSKPRDKQIMRVVYLLRLNPVIFPEGRKTFLVIAVPPVRSDGKNISAAAVSRIGGSPG